MSSKHVLIVGLKPDFIDFSDPAMAAFPGLTADKIEAALHADAAHLRELGYEATLCMTDFGETAEATVTSYLAQTPYDCVLIGAGVRTIPAHFILFEKLVNVVHAHAPQAKLCFNTSPSDTAEAVLRWLPTS